MSQTESRTLCGRRETNVQPIDKRGDIRDIDIAIAIDVSRLIATDFRQRNVQTVDQSREIGDVRSASGIAVNITRGTDTARRVAQSTWATNTVTGIDTAGHIALDLSGHNASAVGQATATSRSTRRRATGRCARRTDSEADATNRGAVGRSRLDTTTTVRQTACSDLADRFAGSRETRNVVTLVDAAMSLAVSRRDNHASAGRQTAGAAERLARIRCARRSVTLPCTVAILTIGRGCDNAYAVLKATSTL